MGYRKGDHNDDPRSTRSAFLRTSLRRLPITGLAIIALGLSLIGFGARASAWTAPTLVARCAPDSTHFAWEITLNAESDQRVEMSWGLPFVKFGLTDFVTAGTHTFTTERVGTTLVVRYEAEQESMASATADTRLCSGGTPTPTGSPTATATGTPTSTPISTPISTPTATPTSSTTTTPTMTATPTGTGTSTGGGVVGSGTTTPGQTSRIVLLPSTSTEQGTTPLALLGSLLVAIGIYMLRKPQARMHDHYVDVKS